MVLRLLLVWTSLMMVEGSLSVEGWKARIHESWMNRGSLEKER
jgi:hypothetical protein